MKPSQEFADQAERVLDYFAQEFDITNAEVIGVLEMVKYRVMAETMADDDEDEA